ncbi:MAG: hypothetical protein V4696_08590 [Pseudomonadota bacterium]
MATYSSPQVTNQMPIQSHGLANTHTVRFPVTLSAAVTTADAIRFGYVPQYARIVDATLVATDMDSGTALAFNVGDAGDVDRLFAAATVGQAGTVARMSVTTGFGYRYDTEGGTLITGAISTNPTGGSAGTITLFLTYVVEDDGVGYPD